MTTHILVPAPFPSADLVSGALTLADRVFSEIQNAIVKGELKPGSKMSEAELASRYGVSRGPLRLSLIHI